MSAAFEFFLPVRILFGAGAMAHLSEEAGARGARRVLLVTGRQSARASGLLDRIAGSLRDAGIETIVFDEALPDPDILLIDRGVRLARDRQCDLVIGCGGGSAIDTAKAIAGLTGETNFFSSADYLEVDGSKTLSRPGLPIISVPVIAGTGAEVTKNAVILNTKNTLKRSIRHVSLYPRLCISDPSLAVGAPPAITASAGIDALCHLLEGFISSKATAMTDTLALEGIARIHRSLLAAYRHPSRLNYREDIAFASLLGGMVIANAGLTLSHAVGSVIGPRFSIPHGIACAVTLAETVRFNWEDIPEFKQAALERIFGPGIPGYLRLLLRDLDIPQELSRYTITNVDLEEISTQALAASSAKGNPRPCSAGELKNMLLTLL